MFHYNEQAVKKANTAGTGLIVVGIVALVVFFPIAGALLVVGATVPGLLVMLIGVYIIHLGRAAKKKNRLYQQYAGYLYYDTTLSLTGLAAYTRTDIQTVRKNMRQILKVKGFFPEGAYITANDCLYFPGAEQAAERMVSLRAKVPGTGARPTMPAAPAYSVKCPGCGAKAVAQKGMVSQCEYCGTSIGGV